MIKAVITPIRPKTVIDDLRAAGAKKLAEPQCLIEYFDFDKENVTSSLPQQKTIRPILRTLNSLAKRGKTLESQKMTLYLEEKDTYCQLVLQHTDSKDQTCIALPLREWANVEEILLQCGYKLVQRVEVNCQHFYFGALHAYFTVKTHNRSSSLCVDAPSELQMIEALALVGFDIKQAVVTETVRRRKRTTGG